MLPTPLSAPSRVALASAATGIRDAAGNLSAFAATAPTDGARPVLVAGTLVMRDVDGKRQGRPRARHLLARRSSPPPTPHPGRSRTSPAQARSPRSRPRARLRRSSSAEGAGAAEHRRRHLPGGARRERDRYPRRRRKPGLLRLDRSRRPGNARARLARHAGREHERQGRPCPRHLLGDARGLQRGNRSLDARERALGRKPELGLGRGGRRDAHDRRGCRCSRHRCRLLHASRLRALRPASATRRATSRPSPPRRRRTRRGRCRSASRPRTTASPPG